MDKVLICKDCNQEFLFPVECTCDNKSLLLYRKTLELLILRNKKNDSINISLSQQLQKVKLLMYRSNPNNVEALEFFGFSVPSRCPNCKTKIRKKHKIQGIRKPV